MVHYGGFTVSFRVLSQKCMTGCNCVVLELAPLEGEKNSEGFFLKFLLHIPIHFIWESPQLGLILAVIINHC